MDQHTSGPAPPPAPPSPAYSDRTTLLIVFGFIQIALGVLCFLLIAVMIGLNFYVSTFGDEALPQTQSTTALVIIYGLGGVCLAWLGVGSIMARRWARALNLTLSSAFLAMGVLAMIFMAIIFVPGDIHLPIEAQEEIPPGLMNVMFLAMFVPMFGIYIAIPGAFVLVYRSPHVKATCEHKDPKIRWTDKCPLPVLAVSLVCGMGAVSCFAAIFWMKVFPFFGTIVAGLPAAVMFILFALVLAGISWGTYKLRPVAWWGSLLFITLGAATMSITYYVMDIEALYVAMGYPAKQIEMMRSMGLLDMMSSPAMAGSIVVMGFCYAGYLLYIKRYFAPAGDACAQPSA